jgi:hypothetical protein
MNRTRFVLALGVTALAVAAPLTGQVIVTDTQVTTQFPGAAGGRGAAPMPMGTGLIVGQAVEADSTRPVPGVLVTLSLPGASPLRALADGQGRFAFRDLPKGRYGITISKAGYVDGAHGRVRPAGPTLPIDLGEGQRLGGITIPIWKYAAIAGYVMDEQNEPLVGAQVRVLKRSIVGGHWRLVPGPTDLTDDRGAYRIGALEPGEYVVAMPMSQSSDVSISSFVNLDGARDVVTFGNVAQARVAAVASAGGAIRVDSLIGGGGATPPPDEEGRPQAYPTQFYPGASTSTRAAAVSLGSGEERNGVDFQLKPVRTVRVTGSIIGPDGPAANMPVTLVPAETGDLSSPIETLSAFSDASGTFTFAAVPAGQYTLQASRGARGGMPMEMITQMGAGGVAVRAVTVTRAGGPPPPLPTEPTLWAETAVAVGTTDVDDIVVSLREGLKVSGSIQFDGGAARPPADQLSAISVWLEPANPRPGGSTSIRGRVDPSGQFETMGVPPGHYFVRVAGAPQNWYFRGAMLGGQDVSDAPLALESENATGVMLTFTDRPADLSGQVTDANAGDNAATVIIFPADSAAWSGYGSTTRRLRNVRADKDGRYSAQNLPPGDYLVAAVPDKQAGDWQNPKFLESLAQSATRVRIGAGEKVTQNVQVVR